MRWTGFCIVPLLLHAVATSVAGCCDAADVQPAAYRSDDRGASPGPLRLRSVIARALSRVRESTTDRRLAGDLWLETVDSNRRDGSRSLPDDLVAQADAVFDNHRLSWRDALVRGLDLNVYKDRELQRYVLGVTQRTSDSQSFVSRTFGIRRRRMQMFFMLPVMYKLGVITTLLTGLVVLTLKGVTIGVILLVIALTGLVAKLSKFHNPYMSPIPEVSAWSGYHHDPYDRSSQQQSPPPPSQDKNIHVHVHTAPGPVPSAVGYSPGSAPSAVGYSKGPPPLPPPLDDDDMNNYNNNYYYNGGGGPYWNRAGEEYYDAATINHRGDNHLKLSAESTTASNSVYHRWLG
ncbi:unnamed protein product [Macrosiphum euphorbiae]|uniref:Uncharacterized protein n=1 Tax=Macrosiphum euphorbiae TaxID=13131 RepID=A0AAV0WSG2_9HEMI|nr:unnamed protein product [Macrosiphum euphorbiae]